MICISAAPQGSKPFDTASNGVVLPDGTDLRQVTILSKKDWDRLNYQINKRKIEEDELRRHKEDREELRFRSNEKVKLWTNTIDVSLFILVKYYDFCLTFKTAFCFMEILKVQFL